MNRAWIAARYAFAAVSTGCLREAVWALSSRACSIKSGHCGHAICILQAGDDGPPPEGDAGEIGREMDVDAPNHEEEETTPMEEDTGTTQDNLLEPGTRKPNM